MKQVFLLTEIIGLSAGEQYVQPIWQLAVRVEWLLLQCILWEW